MIDVFSPFGLAVCALACWRVSSMLVHEDGPFDVFAKLRWRVGVRYSQKSVAMSENVIGKLFTCVWCMSVWVAPPVILLPLLSAGIFADLVVAALATSALAIIIESFAKK